MNKCQILHSIERQSILTTRILLCHFLHNRLKLNQSMCLVTLRRMPSSTLFALAGFGPIASILKVSKSDRQRSASSSR